MPSRRVLACLAACLLAAAPPASAAQARRAPAPAIEGAEHAARALDAVLTWSEYHALVIDRHALSQVGRDALNHLLRARLLERLAKESKLAIPDAEVERKWSEMEREIVANAQAASLEEYLRKNRVGAKRFREFLRLGLVQESLARQALGIPAGRPVPGEQQEMWLDQIVQQRGTQFLPPPWTEGVAARCGDLAVSSADFVEHLEQQLVADDVRDDCFQALLAKRARARVPDLAPEAYEKLLDAEVARRRAAAESDARYKGLSFEQILGSQGLTPAALRRDPTVIAAALAQFWVDRAHDDEGLRKVYTDERSWFDQRFGEARSLKLLFLRGARFKSQLNARTFEDAERELEKLRAQIRTAAEFERLAKARSEDPGTRDRGGDVGFVAPGDEEVPAPIREAVFTGPRDDAEHCAGPVRLYNPSGAALVWVGERRPAPGWDEMRARVHNELRRRFLDECLTQKDVVTYLDSE